MDNQPLVMFLLQSGCVRKRGERIPADKGPAAVDQNGGPWQPPYKDKGYHDQTETQNQ
jgi:hypothetical protein